MGGEFQPQELWVEFKLSENDSCASNNKQSVVPCLESPYKQGHANQLDKNLNISESPAQTWTESSLGFDENPLHSPNYIYILFCHTSNLLLGSHRDEDAGALGCSQSIWSLDIPDLVRIVKSQCWEPSGKSPKITLWHDSWLSAADRSVPDKLRCR